MWIPRLAGTECGAALLSTIVFWILLMDTPTFIHVESSIYHAYVVVE